MPSERDMRRIFDDKIRDAYAGLPQARSDHFQAARAIYAALSSDAGDRDTSILDSDRWEQAIQMATGGVEKYNRKNIVLPYGYESSQFRDGLARRVDDLVETGRLDAKWTRSDLLDLPLESAGDGKYVFKVGDADLVDKQGNVVKVDFETSVPFRTSGHGLRAAAEEPTVEELQVASQAVTGRAEGRTRMSQTTPAKKGISGVKGAKVANPDPATIYRNSSGGTRG